MNISKTAYEFISNIDHPQRDLLIELFFYLAENASGKENIVTVKKLKGYFDYEIHVHKIPDLRRFIVDNLPIASTPHGLFYPVSKSDLEAFEHHIKSRIFTMWKRMKRVSESFPELTKEGQLDLFEYERMKEEVKG